MLKGSFLNELSTAVLIFVTSYFRAAYRVNAFDLVLATSKCIKYNLLSNHFYQKLLLYLEYYILVFYVTLYLRGTGGILSWFHDVVLQAFSSFLII